MTTVLTPVARVLLRFGVTPDAVTVAGTVVVTALALTLLPLGHLLLGGLLIGFFVLLDSLDGVLARLSGQASRWGAFLDSTLDRVSDGAVFAGITLYFVLHPDVPYATWGAAAALACLALGGIVPYVRARAEAVGATAKNGFAERPDRLAIGIGPLAFTDAGLPMVAATTALTILAVASAVTVGQRMSTVRRQLVKVPQ
ncbi:phosphatidylinositol phosphate synthase [Myceligenerans xiligouense]|nr:CDP-alcohol phosphatidyltransferase family protein [Myceligenerans xiligouense]